MRGWMVALTVLGIAVAGTGSLIGEQSYVATAMEWSESDFDERELAGALLAAAAEAAPTGEDSETSGWVAVLLADSIAEATADSDAVETDTEIVASPQPGDEPAIPAIPANAVIPAVPSIAAPVQPAIDEEARALRPVVPAPAATGAASVAVPPRPPARTETALPSQPRQPLAIVCLAGCGSNTVVYEAVPTPSGASRRDGRMLHSVIAASEPHSAEIACVAGCYGQYKRAYPLPAAPRSRQSVQADHGFDRTHMRQASATGIRVQRWTKLKRVAY